MTKTFIHFLFIFIVMTIAQVIVFNHICLFGVALPLVFIYTNIKLPMTLNVNWVMTVGFLAGMTVDIFSDTQGMNALACTILSAVRRQILHLYFPREDEMSFPEPSARSLGAGVYMKYAFSMVLVYCALFFVIEAFSFFDPVRLIAKILGSTILTFIIIVAIDSITSSRSEKRL